MSQEKPSTIRVAFGVIGVLVAIYGLWSLGYGVYQLTAGVKAAGNEPDKIGAAIGVAYSLNVGEFGVMRGLLCMMLGTGSLVALSAIDALEQSRTTLAHIWRELAAKSQP